MLTGTRRRRSGFTIIEILVTVGILAVLAAVIIPAVRPRYNHANAAGIIQTLQQLRQAIDAYREDVERYPTSILQLQSRPPAGQAPMTDICGAQVSSAWFNAKWRGPYLAQRVEAIGLQVGNSTVSAQLGYDNLGNRLANVLIRVATVDRTVAVLVDEAFDAQMDHNDGTIRWTEQPTGSDRGTLTYTMRTRGC